MALTPVQKELGKVAADYRRFRMVQALARCWGILSLAGLFFLILAWFGSIHVPYAVPLLLMGGVIAAGVIVHRNSKDEVALRQIARQVEKDDPRLNSLLLAAAEQTPDPQTGDLSFLQIRVIREALEANRRSPWTQKFTERLFFAQCSHLGALVALSVVLAWLASMKPGATGKAVIAASGLQVTPGNVEVERGSALAIVAQFQSDPGAEVVLIYRPVNAPEEILPMARSLNDPLFGASFTDVQQDAKYQVRSGRKVSPEYTISVFEYPQLKRADAALTYPEYTGFPPAKIEDTRRITAVEGSDVAYTFFINKPVRSAILRSKDKEGSDLSLTNASGGEGLVLDLRMPLEETRSYSLELIDKAGRTNKIPADFTFVALTNEVPKMTLQFPKGDQRFSSLQEVRFDAQVQDDFGLAGYGIAYTVAGEPTETARLSALADGPSTLTQPHEARTFQFLLPMELRELEVGQLVSYYLWAEDLGPDGKLRRSASDIYFAEIRPFEEIFRESNTPGGSSEQQQGGGQQNNPAGRLLELQKEIITATWNLQRRETTPKPSRQFKPDAEVVRDSQTSAIEQAQAMRQRVTDGKSRALVDTVVKHMQTSADELASAAKKNSAEPLPGALEAEQSAYQALLKLQAREYQVQRSRNRQQQGGGGGGQQQAQRQLDQLELKEEENRYEMQTEATPLQSPEQRESLQVLNRLKELARRQQDMSERLKELQAALNEARTPEEKEKLQRELKRLMEEQQQIVQDIDEVQQRMSQPENQSRMAEAREQLQNTREQSRQTAEQMQNQNLGQAISSSSRAEQQLDKLSDDFRKSTSSQFAEDMREMRQQARDLEKRQEELSQKLQQEQDSPRRSLSAEGPRAEALNALNQQRAALTNLLQNMREVTEHSELAEPLLSRQLYETLRRASQSSPEKTLELASQLLERNFVPQARQTQEKVTDTIRNLREGVERAAQNVLGDEAESLRFAERELERLADSAERELNAATGRGGTNSLAAASGTNSLDRSSLTVGEGPGQTNRLATANTGGDESGGIRGSTNEITQLAQAGGENGQQPSGLNQESPGGGEEGRQEGASSQNSNNGQTASNSRQGSGQGSQGSGQQQEGQGQQGSSGSEPSQTNSESEPQTAAAGQRGQGGGQAEGQPGQGGGEGGTRNFFEQWAERSRNSNGGGGGPGYDGPITGRDFTSWSDRLRDLEEVLQDPTLRADVARVRDRARDLRTEYKKHAADPKWELVESEVVKPLRILQNRVADELARHGSREAVVPVDRDPVPSKYSELVSRYYEQLGRE